MSSKDLIVFTAFAILATALSGVGCGSDESPRASLSLAKFGDRADIICTNAANEQPELAVAYMKKHPGSSETDLVAPAVIPPLEKMVKELDELGLPHGHEAQAEKFLAEVKKALEAVKEDPESAVSVAGNPFDEPNELARELKLGDCSRNP
jgi:hypothetical protein